VLIGGKFTQINGQTRNHIARLNSDGTLDMTFNAGTAASDYGVLAIAIQSDDKVVIGGQFALVNGISQSNIARLNSDGTLDTSFNPGTGANANVCTVNIQSDGKIIIGGNFDSVNGISRGRVARLNPDGSLDTAFMNLGAGFNNGVYDLSLQPNGKILVGGWFTFFDQLPSNYIARLNTDGTLDLNFNPDKGPDYGVLAIVPQPDGKILIGGAFTHVNNGTFLQVARLDEKGSTNWRIYWDTSSITDQVVNIRAFIGDSAGNGIWANSNGVILDKTSPSYVSSSLVPGSAQIGQSVNINLQTQDNLSGVDHTDAYVNTATDGSGNGDWNLIGTINGCCGSVVWNTTGYQRGRHRIAFDIWDKAGNSNNWVFGSQPNVTVSLGEEYQFLPLIMK
jgi:uncharacterized delta-60 repeat protein